MRRVKWLALVGISGSVPTVLLAVSCGTTGAGSADAGFDAPVDSSLEAPGFGEIGPSPDGSISSCTLNNGSDPVALCTQKIVLAAMHAHAFDPKAGIASSWSPTTGAADVGDAGTRLHAWTDDVGYAAASALYHTSSAVYGDTQLTPVLDNDLIALVPLLESELTPLPASYAGEPYLRLRLAAGGLRTINDLTDGNAVDALADAYGRAIYTKYFFPLAPGDAGDAEHDAGHSPLDGGGDGGHDAGHGQLDAGGGDGGLDASRQDAAPDGGHEAGFVDSGHDSSLVDSGHAHDAGSGTLDASPAGTDGIIGTRTASGYAYLTTSAALAACGLIDLASRNPTDPDVTKWQLAAASVFDHLYLHGRDATTGLYRTALIASGGLGPDPIDPSVANGSLLLSDTTATVALALTEARDIVAANSSALLVVGAYPFGDRIAAALASLNGVPSLYDGPANDASVFPTGFVEGYEPGQGLVYAKSTEANVFALVVLNRQFFTIGTVFGTEMQPLTQTLISTGAPNQSLFTVLVNQSAFFAASSRTFQLLGADAGFAHETSYQSAATLSFVEGMNLMLPAQQ